ncbi:uncharacterized protein ATNIH1004_011309 [Aspergillus tanneri]|uniref:Uncharacterized protein n=1 Tax=Aspergillus tanneri TaxID=1220188 RepID=A0A5M9M5Q7_9EURO|nr:uncharacterized protein ATNIH1004_011309 [Aspergillus tanneri]KAA8642365.1 hypothetical protein ATNIH1004_011309 [Aspergillus tanneri]
MVSAPTAPTIPLNETVDEAPVSDPQEELPEFLVAQQPQAPTNVTDNSPDYQLTSSNRNFATLGISYNSGIFGTNPAGLGTPYQSHIPNANPASFEITEVQRPYVLENNRVRCSNHGDNHVDAQPETDRLQGEADLQECYFASCNQEEDASVVQGASFRATNARARQFNIPDQHQAEEHHHPSPIVNNGYDTLQIAQHPDDTYTYDFDNFLPATPDWSGWYYDFSSNFR